MKEMTNEEYQNFLETINTLSEKEHETIKRGVLQLNDDKKQLLKVISELQQRIDKAIEYIENDLQSFLYSIEYKTLLEILKGGNK